MGTETAKKPLLIYDGDCGFCKQWISLWVEICEGNVEFKPSQEVGKKFPQIPTAQYDKSVVFIAEPGNKQGDTSFGAEAVFEMLTYAPNSKAGKFLLTVYDLLPGFSFFAELAYKLVANNRVFFSTLTRWTIGEGKIKRPTYETSRWIFLKLLGLIYLVAFTSLGGQLAGLVGPRGIYPTSLSAVQVHLLHYGGIVASILTIADIAPFFALLAAWVCYSTLTLITRDFLWFQWDSLLLEMGFWALFLAPIRIFPTLPKEGHKTSASILFLFRWLLFRVLFFSGWVKLASGDLHWRDLTALHYHFETQPLPTWLGWYAHQLPLLIQQGLAVLLFVVELGLPFLIFLPRRCKILAFWIFLAFQILIDSTGNYGFFGLQTAALGVFLLDDTYWQSLLPAKWAHPLKAGPKRPAPQWRKRLNLCGIVFVVLVSALKFPLLTELARELRIVNFYGVFAVMTTTRNEIVIEGSNDSNNWSAYEFKWKPGRLDQAPSFAGPHMPRLDWQMWFAALSSFDRQPWMGNLMAQLLRGSPNVLALLQHNPFPQAPPKYVRALKYRYRFTDWASKRATQDWWSRELVEAYSPTYSLNREPEDHPQ